MSGLGGTKAVRSVAALGLLLAAGLGACTYEDRGDPQRTDGQSLRPAPTGAAKDPDVLAVEGRNYAELERRLAATPGEALLADSGQADGPSVGFKKTATVTKTGPHTVTAACIGIPHAQIYLSQDIKGGSKYTVLEVDCSQTQTQVVQLAAGPVGVQLTRVHPDGAWTGAVAGIRITAP
ncbi:hypothetical protein [uncultured Arthrobacter sp.]|uniref:hypothetical protein n=1 Tax=uncultured Arthrobacter sp. TaxID=114050 RepID=UPI00321650B5